jgi:hypothetical protein
VSGSDERPERPLAEPGSRDRRGRKPLGKHDFRCDDELWEAFVATCEARDEPASFAIRRGIRMYVTQYADVLARYRAEQRGTPYDRRTRDRARQRQAVIERLARGLPERRRFP